MWASVLDDATSLRGSSHILIGFLTDLRNTGEETEDGGVGTSSLSGAGPTILVRKWGTPPHLVRAAKARVELALDPATDWRCYALSHGGRRLAELPVSPTEDGRLALDLDNAAAETATMFWELLSSAPPAPRP